MLGVIIGTYLAVTGAIWTYEMQKKQQIRENVKKTASILKFDIQMVIVQLVTILVSEYPTGKITLLADWHEKVLSLPLPYSLISEITRVYSKLVVVQGDVEKLTGICHSNPENWKET